MKRTSLLLLTFSLWGCSSLSDKTESIAVREKLDHKLQTTDKGNNSYSGDPLEPINVAASGNAKVEIIVGEKGKVEKNEKRDTATEEEVESSFSVDAMLSQVSPAGWALFFICFSIFLTAVWWFIKTTAVGKATEGFLAESIDALNEKLNGATPGTELHTELLSELSRLRGRQKAKR
jgi:hypothetical protein